MKSFTQLAAVSLGVVLTGAVSSYANQAPDFASIIESMQNAQATAPTVQDVDYSQVDTSISGLMASIKRQASSPVIPFSKLAMQYVQGNSVTASAADEEAPFIMVGGYWDTQVSASTGGLVTMVAYVVDPQGHDVTVEIWLGGTATGIFLSDTAEPFPARDGVYCWRYMVEPPNLLPAGQYLLELVATDTTGASGEWPKLVIHP